MKYLILIMLTILLLIAFYIFFQTGKLLFKRAKKAIRRYNENKTTRNTLDSKKRFKIGIYKSNRFIITHTFWAVSFGVFLSLMVITHVAPARLANFFNNFEIVRYANLIWLLYYFKSASQYIRKLSNESNRMWVTVFLVILGILSIWPTWITFLVIISKNVDYVLPIIAILFSIFPTYYLAMSMLDIIVETLSRKLVGILFSLFIAIYTLCVIGIYDQHFTIQNTDHTIMKFIIDILQNKVANIPRLSVQDISTWNITYTVSFCAILLFEAMVIKDILKIASNPRGKTGEAN